MMQFGGTIAKAVFFFIEYSDNSIRDNVSDIEFTLFKRYCKYGQHK